MPFKFSFKTVLSALLIAILYFGVFAALYSLEWGKSPLSSFFRDVVGVLMSAGVVALVTSSVFIFQAKINSDDEKHRSVFEKKVKLYQDIAGVIRDSYEDEKVQIEAQNQLDHFLFEVILLSGPRTIEAYNQLLTTTYSSDEKTSSALAGEILNFFQVARDDLDVQEDMSKRESDKLLDVISAAKQTAKRVATKKRVFTDHQKRQILDEYDSAPRGEKNKILERESLYPSQISDWKKRLNLQTDAD